MKSSERFAILQQLLSDDITGICSHRKHATSVVVYPIQLRTRPNNAGVD